MRTVAIAGSLAVHGAVAWLFAWWMPSPLPPPSPAAISIEIVATDHPVERGAAAATTSEVTPHPGGGGGATASPRSQPTKPPTAARRSRAPTAAARPDPWASVIVHADGGRGIGNGDGDGNGNGDGHGGGHGIGFGDGGGIAGPGELPAPPAAPPASLARPARLIWPTRNAEVEDEAFLFVARITVDASGAVAAVRMITTRPGPRADRAASGIWTFRYDPARDRDGDPIRSTFDQELQVR